MASTTFRAYSPDALHLQAAAGRRHMERQAQLAGVVAALALAAVARQVDAAAEWDGGRLLVIAAAGEVDGVERKAGQVSILPQPGR